MLVSRGCPSSPFSMSWIFKLDELCSPSRSAMTRNGAKPEGLRFSNLGRLLKPLTEDLSFSMAYSDGCCWLFLVGDVDRRFSLLAPCGRTAVSPLTENGKQVPLSKLDVGLPPALLIDFGEFGDSGLDSGELKTEETAWGKRPPVGIGLDTLDNRRRKAISISGKSSSPIRFRLCFW